MTKLREIFDRDPGRGRLANNGQARIIQSPDADEMAILRHEIEDFVCEGAFEESIERVLSEFMTAHSGGSGQQRAAWISGFFGSGKSHLLKMLAHFWVDTDFDGVRARDLPRRGLPDTITPHLTELDKIATQTGTTPVAAAGTLLGGNEHVRRTVLEIILVATGWPRQYPQAMFCFYLRGLDILDRVRTEVEGQGKGWHDELDNMLVSPLIGQAVANALPQNFNTASDALKALQSQFPVPKTDITSADFKKAVGDALRQGDQIPPTLLVLDEVQQYINESSDRARTIVEITETLQKEFDARIMVIAAGQSALTAGQSALQWLNDRFEIKRQLTDASVEQVIRSVLLAKKESFKPAVRSILDDNQGEIARHLDGTRLESTPDDQHIDAVDYPLLPTRRRFWEKSFHAVDKEGSQGQLRSQLRIVNDSLKSLADEPLGSVIPASDLYNALSAALTNNNILPNELSSRIAKLDDGTEDGRLRRDLCGLCFLIGQLPREDGVDDGVRATADQLADLLVPTITGTSGPFREQCKALLEAMADAGTLMRVDGEYRLQTSEGARWEAQFQQARTGAANQGAQIEFHRGQEFGRRVQEIVGRVKATQGRSKTARTLAVHESQSEPPAGDSIAVWVRDGWSAQESAVLADARQLGQDDATIHVHLPRKSADELKNRIVERMAAQEVLDRNSNPGTPEGREARSAMQNRLDAAQQNRDSLIEGIFRQAKVFTSGGTEVYGDDLAAKITNAIDTSMTRKFPRFHEADHDKWSAAMKRARDGSDSALGIVDWTDPAEEHDVAREITREVRGGQKTGSELRKSLRGAPFGWPQDAIDAMLVVLVQSGHLRAEKNAKPVSAAALDGTVIAKASFASEAVVLTTTDKIALRGLYSQLDFRCKSGEESITAPQFIAAWRKLAQDAGGEAPLPETPDLSRVAEIDSRSGNDQLVSMASQKDDIAAEIGAWKTLAERRESRLAIWSLAERLLTHAEDRPGTTEIRTELDAINAQRSLLAETDPVAPVLHRLAEIARGALHDRHQTLTNAITESHAALETDATWTALDGSGRKTILDRVSLAVPAPLSVSGDNELATTLDRRPLDAWEAEIAAVDQRRLDALAAAAKTRQQADPAIVTTTVAVDRGTLADEPAVRAWIDAQEKKLLEAVKTGPVIVR
jgi:hypothetical protein